MKNHYVVALLVLVISVCPTRIWAQDESGGSKSQENSKAESSSRDTVKEQGPGSTERVADSFYGRSIQPSGRVHFGILWPIVGVMWTASALKRADVRWLFDSGIGTAAGLGYKLPDTNFVLALEKPIGTRFEYQATVGYSPSKKFITGDGHSFLTSTQGLVWIRHNVAFVGGIRYSKLWTSQFVKQGSFPVAGIAIREYVHYWEGPGRTYVTYEFATGCVWATPTNPCTIQSNRLQGVNFRQEFSMSRHLRLALDYGLWHFCDQGNPFAPNVPRSCHMTVTSQMVFRYEFHPLNQDKTY